MDADLSHNPKYLIDMINKQRQNDYDIVLGSWYIDKGGIEGWSFYWKLTSRVANYLSNTLLGTQVSDLTNSFWIYKRNVFEKLSEKVQNKGFGFQMEIIVLS